MAAALTRITIVPGVAFNTRARSIDRAHFPFATFGVDTALVRWGGGFGCRRVGGLAGAGDGSGG